MLLTNKPKKSYSWAIFKRLWPYIKPYRHALIFAVIGLVLNAGAESGLLALIKPLLDNGLMDKDYSLIIWIAIGIVILITLRGLTNYASTYCLSWVSGKVVMTFRQQVFSHFMRSPVSYHDKNSVGDSVAIITFNAEMVSQASSDALIIIVRETMYSVGLLTVMFYGSWQLALIVLVIIPIVIFVANFIAKKFKDIVKTIQRSIGTITTVTDQMLKGHKEVLIYNAKQQEKDNFKDTSDVVRRGMLKIAAISSLSSPITQLIAAVGLGIILYIVARSYIDISPGSFILVFSAMVAIMRPMRELTSVHVQLQQGFIACESLFAVLDSPLEKDSGTINVERVKGHIEFKHVTYTYPGQSNPALNDINFKIKAGETIALVGRSGSGKTTITSLLARFYDIETGSIMIDDINITDYTLASLRSQIGLVSQQVHLFHDTVANNIAYGREDYYTREQIINAAEKANAMDFIAQMEHGLDTIIGDNGTLLSGGQRQRLAIARVLLRDNPILILDEATSALDTESEIAVQASFDEVCQNRTTLVIAHRLSTIQNADRILVIDNGKIIEQGNHEQLLVKNGIYAQMHQIQFDGIAGSLFDDETLVADNNLNSSRTSNES
ncbi:lipid A export permease/ATP-binding protein MsbA [Orbus sturtevantii]